MAAEDSIAVPLKILVVGAGIAGLAAAIGLREQGHQVELFERSKLAEEEGAAIHLQPNCVGILRRLGIHPEAFGSNPLQGRMEYDFDGNLRLDLDVTESQKIWQHPWFLSYRLHLHNELKRLALSPTGKGLPAILRTSCRVTNVETSSATITLEDGSEFSGDLVIGADGMSSVARKAIVGDDIRPFPSGKSAFRFLIPREKVLANPVTEHFANRPGYIIIWYGNDRRIVMYPCCNNTMMNFVAIHPSELSGHKGEGWDIDGSKEILFEIFKDFGPAVRALLELADRTELKLWTLLDMAELPSWVKGKLVLVGDAAHPFLPYQGQGGSIAIEDVASLCVLLRKGVTKKEIPERLALYGKLRPDRAHQVQEFSRIAGANMDDKSRQEFNIMQFIKLNLYYDEWHNSTHELNKWLWQRHGNPIRRQPISFGPMVGPRQDHLGRPLSLRDATFTTHSIRFKSSATYLQTLFPSPAFSFAYPGTMVETTFQWTELDNLRWLGGSGYNSFSFSIHGVRYTKKDGSSLCGSFLPVIFENLSDSIVADREELGMPKVFSDIVVTKGGKSSRVVCSWRGTTFIDMMIDGLGEGLPENEKERPAGPTTPSNQGTFVYRYVPAVGARGEAYGEYPVFISNEHETARVVEKTLRGTDQRVVIQSGDWDSLPTLHHIASGLADVPIYQVIEAKQEQGHGMDGFSHAVRIE
ncbi:related to salicylate 1-monooxygenase [Cephalotrichum gorgonifer]|uniref:Related to salicylate 1-monooxygenase n=1 Tax=Cephalotrichum gorgonifer TaxID=2041049 RepID=A0AAE8N6V7_9PEZI|nr:related to salicylate 1-monooxygenase [Cephalotrichum gorgonifer]